MKNLGVRFLLVLSRTWRRCLGFLTPEGLARRDPSALRDLLTNGVLAGTGEGQPSWCREYN